MRGDPVTAASVVTEVGWGAQLACVHLKMGRRAHPALLATGPGHVSPAPFLPCGPYPSFLALWMLIYSLVSEACVSLQC